MKIFNKRTLVGGGVVVLTIFVVSAAFLFWKINLSNEADEKTIYESTTNSSSFAVKLSLSDGTEESYDSSEGWPSSDEFEFDEENSYCIDSNGNKEYGVISYYEKNGASAVRFYTTSFKSCTLVFNEIKITDLTKAYNKWGDLETIMDNNGTKDIEDIWESTLTGDGFRYVGTNPDNYICFGTTDATTCKNNSSTYMYRIIGIFQDSSGNWHLKLIKRSGLTDTQMWHSSDSDVDWSSSSLYKGLNGSYFLTNSTDYSYMQSSTWKNKIYTWTWTAVNTTTDESPVGPSYYLNTATIVYYHETKQLSLLTNNSCYYESGVSSSDACQNGEWTTVKAKIGLMYASDYLLSLGSEALNYTSGNYNSTLKTGWMNITKNGGVGAEWTMSREGAGTNYHSAYAVSSTGSVMGYIVSYENVNGNTNTFNIRPVFYLVTSATVVDGIGTQSDPYILSVS